MIEIWYCDITPYTQRDFEQLLCKFDENEQQEILKFKFLKDRLFRCLGRLLVEMKYEVSSNEIDKTPEGKPYLKSGQKFNISHAGQIVAVAFSKDEIGLDIEEKKPIQMDGIIDFFHPIEIEFINNLSEHRQVDAFYKVWTRKEAFLKALGQGIVNGINQHNCIENTLLQKDQKWNIQSSEELTNYSLAVCSAGEVGSIILRKIG